MGDEPLHCVRKDWEEAPLPVSATSFLQEVQRRIEGGAFPEAFVPADYALVYQALAQIERPAPRTFLEWGCGLGVVTGLAAMLNWQAEGVEQDQGLANEASALLDTFGLAADIYCGDLREWPINADLVYMYMWPEETPAYLEHFAKHASPQSQILYFDGADTLRLLSATR